MKCNVDDVNRKLRIVVGLAIIAAGRYFKSGSRPIVVTPLFARTTDWYLAYLLFGISTKNECRHSEHKSTVVSRFQYV